MLSVNVGEMKSITKEEVLQLIGHVTVFYATLDVFVATLCHSLIPYGSVDRRRLRGAMTLGQRAKLLGELDSESVTNPDALREFQSRLPEIIELSEIRNRFIHDQWNFNQENLARGEIVSLRFEFGRDGGLLTENTHYTAATMRALLKRVGEAQGIVTAALAMVSSNQVPIRRDQPPETPNKSR